MFKFALFVCLVVVACSLPLDQSSSERPPEAFGAPKHTKASPKPHTATSLKPKDHSDKPAKGASKDGKEAKAPAKSAAKGAAKDAAQKDVAQKDAGQKVSPKPEPIKHFSSERPLEQFSSEMPEIELASSERPDIDDKTSSEPRLSPLDKDDKEKDHSSERPLEWSSEAMQMSGDHDVIDRSSLEPLSEEYSVYSTEEIRVSSDLPEKKEEKIDEKKKGDDKDNEKKE